MTHEKCNVIVRQALLHEVRLCERANGSLAGIGRRSGAPSTQVREKGTSSTLQYVHPSVEVLDNLIKGCNRLADPYVTPYVLCLDTVFLLWCVASIVH